MEGKFFFFIFFIFSLIFSSNENLEKKRDWTENKILDLHGKNPHENKLNFVQLNAENLQNSNTQNVTNFSDLFKTKEEENVEVPFDLLKTQEEKENISIPVNLLNTHEDAKSSTISCNLLNIKRNLFRHIFAYLSFFELEFNFKYVSTTIYNLCENFSQEEKNLLIKNHLNSQVNFLQNINYMRIYFDFF